MPRKRKIDHWEEIKLWVRAGGICEFPGCNKYLLEDELTGTPDINLADKAHIAPFSPKGPRSGSTFKQGDREKAENLMLLCSEHHHKIIDNPKLEPEYTEQKLRDSKEMHEDHIRHVTGLRREFGTTPIRLIGNIRGQKVSVSDSEIREAVITARRYPRYLGTKRNSVEIDLSGLAENPADSHFWQAGISSINDVVDGQLKPAIQKGNIPHISVFALARIPFLIYLGYRLDDKVPVTIYQKHRTGKENWSWNNGTDVVQFQIQKEHPSNECSSVAIILSISGKVDRREIGSHIDDSTAVYEIHPQNHSPGRNLTQSQATLENFRSAFESLLREIEAKHKGVPAVKLFPAVPLSMAVACGRELLKDVTPRFDIFDRDTKEYTFSIGVG